MEIKLTDTIRIKRADKFNIVVEEFAKIDEKTQEEKWNVLGYFPTIDLALQVAIERDWLLKIDDAETIEIYINSIRQAKEEIYERLKGLVK